MEPSTYAFHRTHSVSAYQTVPDRQRTPDPLRSDRGGTGFCFDYLDHGLRCGDVYIEGSKAYADYRQQLFPWDECAPCGPAYCQVWFAKQGMQKPGRLPSPRGATPATQVVPYTQESHRCA